MGDQPKICTHYKKGNELYRSLPVQKQPVDLKQQVELTQLLTKVQPQYQQLNSRRDLILAIERELGISVSLCSIGPTYKDKISLEKMDKEISMGALVNYNCSLCSGN